MEEEEEEEGGGVDGSRASVGGGISPLRVKKSRKRRKNKVDVR